MIISEINPVTSGSTELAAAQQPVLGKEDFLHLLITQLQNQDPLSPTDHTEFTAQLAQFSSLEQLSNVNDNLEQLQNFQASTNNSQAVSLLGKEITANGNFLKLTDGEPIGCDFSLNRDAAVVVVNIYDSTGEFVKAFETKDLAAGRHTLVWDGTDRNGNPAKDGNYTFEILAADANDQNVNVTAFFSGTVNTVIFENNTPFLISGGQKIALGDVIQVAAPENSVADPQLEEQNNTLTNGGK
jgi:flagellar basal-body rod modification protein FlgD